MGSPFPGSLAALPRARCSCWLTVSLDGDLVSQMHLYCLLKGEFERAELCTRQFFSVWFAQRLLRFEWSVFLGRGNSNLTAGGPSYCRLALVRLQRVQRTEGELESVLRSRVRAFTSFSWNLCHVYI